jgi:phage repressor protein C with HTH and peptisase S24 domain
MKAGEISAGEFEKLRENSGPIFKFRIVTGSMSPLIPVGASVVVDGKAEIKPHDIIVFWHDEKLICHVLWHENKIIQKNGQKIYVTRPLRGSYRDFSILESQVLGRVVNYQLPRWRLWLMRWSDMGNLRRRRSSR